MMWEIVSVYYPVRDTERFRVIAKNGQWIAECKTNKYAERIVRGLILEATEAKKIKDFRI